MKKFCLCIAFMACISNAAFALSFQQRHDILGERNYFNPASTAYENGHYLKAYTNYEFNVPANAGKNPLDLSLDYFLARDRYSAFATLNTDSYSYFSSHTISGGFSYNFRNIGGSEHGLRIGGRLLISFNNVNFGALPYGQSGTRLLTDPDIDLGLQYDYKFFHWGFSVKNIFSLGGRYEGIQYVTYPRAFFSNMYFDVNLLQGNIVLMPFGMLAVNQNIMIAVGMDARIYDFFRIEYAFRAPDLSHNITMSFTIAKRVSLCAGCSVTPAHKYASLHGSVRIRLAK